MKNFLFIGILIIVVAFTWARSSTTPQTIQKHRIHLLGEKECTYGPSYWCQNLTNAGNCHATKHCVQTVWIHKKYPEDHSSICDTCKSMVQQARDQLESNETQEEIKEVFEGSCALLRLKLIVKECDKIADEFIPDLIETLASEMDPTTVCTVAGLCNNARFDKLLAESGEIVLNNDNKQNTDATAIDKRCDNCKTVMDLVVANFHNAKRDEFLDFVLNICGKMGSFSDACSSVVINHFHELYAFLNENLNSDEFCLFSGECYTTFHRHDVEITPLSKIGYVPVKDDVPCELCEQLVIHLRDILIANTTEAEFKLVLEGLCKQSKTSFSKECLNIVDTYYDLIYNELIHTLDPNATCKLIGICPNSEKISLIAPVLSVETAETARKLNQQLKATRNDDLIISVNKPEQELLEPPSSDVLLPIELLVPFHQQVYNQQYCVFCQYFLHFLQNEITNPKVEDKIKAIIDKACSKLPVSVNETCVDFVNTYEPALVAILAQEIDPSQVCPLLKVCPGENFKDVDIFKSAKSSSECPLCLYAVTEMESIVKGKKSKAEIKADLQKVCDHLPGNLKPECTSFVNTYSDQLVEMLIANFQPEEVCVFLKLCTDNTPVQKKPTFIKELAMSGANIETNEIFDYTYGGHDIKSVNDEKCVLCEFVMKEVDDQLKNKKTDDEIKNIVHGICKILPKSVSVSCNNFVNQYADAIIILLQETMDPSSICSYLKFCNKQQHPLNFALEEITKCGVCSTTAEIMHSILKNPNINQNIEHIFDKTCRGIPSNMYKMCEKITKENGMMLVTLLSRENSGPDLVCQSLSYCTSTGHVEIN